MAIRRSDNHVVRDFHGPLTGPALQVEIDHWRDVERDHLRKQQSTHHGDAQGRAQLRPRAKPQGDGQSAHERGEGGHHDGPKAQHTRAANGLLGVHAFVALGFQRKINHHDGVLFDNTNQHQNADGGNQSEVNLEEP